MFKPRNKPSTLARARAALWPRSGLKRTGWYVWHRIRRIRATPHAIGLGMATGVFMGFSPLIGFHLILATIICSLIGGSIIAAAVGTLVCNPLMCPLMMVGNYQLGMLLVGEKIREDFEFHAPSIEMNHLISDPLYVVHELATALAPVFLPMMLGSLLLGLAAAIPMYFATRSAIQTYHRRRRERLRAKGHLTRA